MDTDSKEKGYLGTGFLIGRATHNRFKANQSKAIFCECGKIRGRNYKCFEVAQTDFSVLCKQIKPDTNQILNKPQGRCFCNKLTTLFKRQ